jgi:hypothetical protein
MEAEKKPGLFQDVYHATARDHVLYIKLQYTGVAVIICCRPSKISSFKQTYQG